MEYAVPSEVTAPQNDFSSILAKTLSYEGSGLNVSKKERSKYGVLETNYHSYLKQNGKPVQPIDKISKPEVEDFYYKNVYLKNNLDKLPQRVSATVFDYTTQSGVYGIKALQRAVGVDPDGKVGPITLEAAKKYIAQNGEDALIENIFNQRREHYKRLVAKGLEPGILDRVDKAELDWLRVNYGIRNLKK